MQLFIEPLDVWLFRDGRPFDAMSDHRAESVFPPYPTVMQGVIRSHQLALQNVELTDRTAVKAAVGDDTDYKTLRLRGPVLARREHKGSITRLFPVPADAIVRNGMARSLAPQKPPAGLVSNLPTELALWPKGEPQKGDAVGWLDAAGLDLCLTNQDAPVILAQTLFSRETRPGIGLEDSRRTTREGALYEVEFIRPHTNVGLWVELTGDEYGDWPADGMLRIGGESRGAVYTQFDGEGWPAPPESLPERFKIYLATPAYFEEGWRPTSWSRYFTGKVELKAAAISRFESMGGFSRAADPKSAAAHRPARRFVPAGSVYFFEAKDGGALRNDLVQNAITEFGAEIGFGQFIIRGW